MKKNMFEIINNNNIIKSKCDILNTKTHQFNIKVFKKFWKRGIQKHYIT